MSIKALLVQVAIGVGVSVATLAIVEALRASGQKKLFPEPVAPGYGKT